MPSVLLFIVLLGDSVSRRKLILTWGKMSKAATLGSSPQLRKEAKRRRRRAVETNKVVLTQCILQLEGFE